MFDTDPFSDQPDDPWRPGSESDEYTREYRDVDEPAITAPPGYEESADLPAEINDWQPTVLRDAEPTTHAVPAIEDIADDGDEFSGTGIQRADASQDEPQDASHRPIVEEVRDSENILTDKELSDTLLIGVYAVGAERLNRIFEASRHLNVPGYQHPVIKDEYVSHKKELAEMANYADAVNGSAVETEAADDLLVHALQESHRPQVNPANRVVASVTDLIDSLADTHQVPTEADLNAAHQMLWVAGEVDEAAGALLACEAGCRAGLQLNDSANLVERIMTDANPRYASYSTHSLRTALESLNEAQVDPITTQEVFNNLSQVNHEYRESTYSALMHIIDRTRESGIPSTEVMETIRSQTAPDRPVDAIIYDIQTYGYDVVRRFE